MSEYTVIVIGWGGLLTYPKFFQEIDISSNVDYWKNKGPLLPLEYSHKCDNGGLSFVVDHTNGVPTKTHFWSSVKTGFVQQVYLFF
jgi:hypothetical protein